MQHRKCAAQRRYAADDEGFEAEASTSPREIKSKIQHFGANLLLLDYRMPEQSGSDVVRELRADPMFKALPIIILTGLDGEEEKIDFLSTRKFNICFARLSVVFIKLASTCVVIF